MGPVGSLCNLNCTYCYYLHKEDVLADTTRGPMAHDLLEEFIRQSIAAQDVDRVLFNWHGGEPALLGLDFFRKVVELERKYAGAKRIENDFQTNGVLLALPAKANVRRTASSRRRTASPG